jgi:hypothetical protein
MVAYHPDSIKPGRPRRGPAGIFDGAEVAKTGGLASTATPGSRLSRRDSSPRVPKGVLLYLGSIGLVGAVIVGLLFGSVFVLLSQASKQTHTASGIHCSDTGFDPRRPSRPFASAETV